MKKCNDTNGNRTRDLVEQCHNQLRDRVSDLSCVPHADAVAEIVSWMNLTVRRKSHESARHCESWYSDQNEIRRHFSVGKWNANQYFGIKADGTVWRKFETFWDRNTWFIHARMIRSRVQKFPAWHTKAAPGGKCCEGYIVPSVVRLTF